MPTFQYIASGPKGDAVRGEQIANDKSDLVRKLQAKGLFLVSCRTDDIAIAAPQIQNGSRPQISAPAAHPSHAAGTYSAPRSTNEASTASTVHAWWDNLLNQQKQ